MSVFLYNGIELHGPWDDEPDKLEWEYSGFPCDIRRNHFGSFCGYAGVPKEHILYGVDYGSENRAIKRVANSNFQLATIYSPELIFNVHGGITFSGHLHENKEYWYFGFDCAHYLDLAPYMLQFTQMTMGKEVYRDINYVKSQTQELADQLKEFM